MAYLSTYPFDGKVTLRFDEATDAQLEENPHVRAVALTGSEAAGAVVAALAGQSLKKSTLELGGSDAFIVLEDADLDKAVKHAVSGRMGNAGQACTASKRFVVVAAPAERFLQMFQDALQGFLPGDPMDPRTKLAPLSSAQAPRRPRCRSQPALEHRARGPDPDETAPRHEGCTGSAPVSPRALDQPPEQPPDPTRRRPPRPRNYSWAELMRRVVAVDVLSAPPATAA